MLLLSLSHLSDCCCRRFCHHWRIKYHNIRVYSFAINTFISVVGAVVIVVARRGVVDLSRFSTNQWPERDLILIDSTAPSLPIFGAGADEDGLTGNDVDDVILQFAAREDVVAGQVHVLLDVEREVLEDVPLDGGETGDLVEEVATQFVLNLLTQSHVKTGEEGLNRVVRILIPVGIKNSKKRF